MIVGPGIHPCSIAARSAVSAYMPLLPTSRMTVKPEPSSCSAFDAAWIARSGGRVRHEGEVVDVVFGDFLVGQGQVGVRVHQAGQHRQLRQVDDLGTRRDRHIRAESR